MSAATTGGEPQRAGPQLIDAIAWLKQLRGAEGEFVQHPVSRLQRRFWLGYRHASALAQALVEHGAWRMEYDADNIRCARLLPGLASEMVE